jgi:hypothetical protein
MALSLALGVSAFGQVRASREQLQRTYPVISRETYLRVLDAVFPRNDPDPSKTIFEFVLRFRPSFHVTSQIVIRNRGDRTELTEYTSLDGNIFDKLNETLARGGKENVTALAKSIKVRQREILIPETQMKGWYDRFFEAVEVTGKTLKQTGDESFRTRSVTLVLDGTIYEMWYKQGLSEISLSLYDVEIDTSGSDGELKLVQWMNSIRREAAKIK